ncbi:uncharacterized protein LOC143211508 isoform X2 [Lasioglossum baleicum]|uniref:uncharacterized protein LOC143211508 isoform X2 n=1 Tax=Lasioglossum baleicum TaxID=434251 RepID=UPI003FCC4760
MSIRFVSPCRQGNLGSTFGALSVERRWLPRIRFTTVRTKLTIALSFLHKIGCRFAKSCDRRSENKGSYHKRRILSMSYLAQALYILFRLGDRLIPRTSDRIFTDFTRDERKALYEYVVSRTIKVDAGHDFTNTDTSVYQDKDNKELSFLELLVQERNLKRRRAKHRGVHTNKKSHMEILREIIDQQMEIYTDHVAQQHRINSDTKAVDIVKTETPTKHLGDTVQNASSSSPIDSPYDGRNFVRRDSQHYHGVSNFRNDRTEASHANTFKDRHKRDKHSRSTTESRKTQRHRKHKRSRSRERDYSKKSRSEFTEKAYARGVTKYDETGRFNDAGY